MKINKIMVAPVQKTKQMKDSGIEWIGEIPESWEVIKLGKLGIFTASGIDKKTIEGQQKVKIINYTDIYGNKTLILNNKDYMVVTATNEQIKKHCVKEGDLIFTPSSETKEDIGLSVLINENLNNTSFSYHVLRFQFIKETFKQFKKYLCNNDYVLNYFSSRATGTIRQTLNRDDFKEALVIFPPLQDQQKIANYLDKKCSKIDKIVNDQKSVIEKLKEYKQSLISEIVTKGLKKNVKMKDSGTEWIGKIPENWQIKRIKYILEQSKDGIKIGPFGSMLKDKTLEEGCYKIYNQAHLVNNNFDLNRHFISENTFNELKNYEIKPNDILLSMMGTIGKCKTMPLNKMIGIMDSHILKIRLNKNYSQRYFEYIFDKDNSNIVIFQLNYYSKGSIMDGLNSQIVKNIYITEPSLSEQLQIVGYLDKKCSQIDNTIFQKETFIEKLLEYKKSLIFECVTGKKEII